MHLSKSLSSDIAEVLSNAGNPSKITDRVSEGSETKKDSEKTGVHYRMFTWCGPKAKIINKVIRTKLTCDKIERKTFKLQQTLKESRPESLKTPRNVIQKVTISQMKFTDQCMKREISSLKLLDENVTRTLLDATVLLGHANCELIQRRRDMIRLDLNNQYKQIGAEHVDFTDWMYGRDLPK